MLEVRYVIMIKDADSEEFVENISANYGIVTEIQNEYADFAETIPIRLVFVTSSMEQFRQIRSDLHCITPEGNEYFLIPMSNEEEKLKALKGGF